MSEPITSADAVSDRLATDGFAGPFPLGSAAEMGLVGLQLVKSVFARPGPFADDVFIDRHLDSPLVAHLATHPAILARVQPLLGADLIVWRSIFFSKGPAGKEVPWHQDGHYWHLDPPTTLTAWLAIDRAHRADHCLEFIPGSHLSALPHVPAPAGAQFPETTDPGSFDTSRAIEFPIDAGTFVLFDQRVVHRSKGGGETRRLALSVRIAPAHVRIDRSLLPPGGLVLPVGWRSVADTPAAAIREALPRPGSAP
ncbi:MAG TPA: phytanoyl-CoA dioxygenase family protein [Candidatus Acidoferrum sp.]|nr:phytanoyl-CoA dioxygenase family protein [Candidatus Acidoferrum sp.]